MDPTNLPNSNFDLPPVQSPEANQAMGGPGTTERAGQVPPMPGLAQTEAGPRPMTEQQNMERPAVAAPVPPPGGPAAAPPAAGNPAGWAGQAVNPGGLPPAGAGSPSNGLTASDSDLIEKAWVRTAKAIIEQTREDPYKQNKEINKVKTEYVKKRYNKDIKLIDE